MEKLITGIHHVNVKPADAETYEKTIAFYRDVLGLELVSADAAKRSAKLSTGAGIIEVGAGEEKLSGGAITHVALSTRFVDEAAEKCRAAGYEITRGPLSPREGLRIAFVTGPCGESIELYDER